jgi:hypothetical protein
MKEGWKVRVSERREGRTRREEFGEVGMAGQGYRVMGTEEKRTPWGQCWKGSKGSRIGV